MKLSTKLTLPRMVRFLLASLSVVMFIGWLLTFMIISPREKEQLELAKYLGVNMQEYPHPTTFPSGYFSSVLKPGMDMNEVHSIVKGYEKVMHCNNVSEIYYYFSMDLRNAERFKLTYDKDNRYMGFQGEDPDSRTLWTAGCVPGLLEE